MAMPTARFMRHMSHDEWYKSAALYELSVPVELCACGFLTAAKYVIVAFSPKAADHGLKETTIFAANKNGSLFGGFWDRKSRNPEDHTYVIQLGLDTGAELECCRVVGRDDPKAALNKLGYKLVD